MEDTPEPRERLCSNIMDDLEEKIGENIREHVVVKRIFAINDFRGALQRIQRHSPWPVTYT